jgi:hypothetical protein
MTIKLSGLTARQKQVINLLWNCPTIEAAQALVAALPTHRDRCDARAMLTMVAHDSIEQEEGLDQYAKAASDCISRC